jgi:hypothetical protein
MGLLGRDATGDQSLGRIGPGLDAAGMIPVVYQNNTSSGKDGCIISQHWKSGTIGRTVLSVIPITASRYAD